MPQQWAWQPRQLGSRDNRLWCLAPSTLKLVFHRENRGDCSRQASMPSPHLLLFPSSKPVWSRLLCLYSHTNPRLSCEGPGETRGEEPTRGCKFPLFSWLPGKPFSVVAHTQLWAVCYIFRLLYFRSAWDLAHAVKHLAFCVSLKGIPFPKIAGQLAALEPQLFGRFRKSCDFTNYADGF